MEQIYWNNDEEIKHRILTTDHGVKIMVPLPVSFWQRYDELEAEGWSMARYAALAWDDALASPISEEQRYEEYRRMMIQVVFKASDAQIGIERGYNNDNRPDQADLWACC